MLKASSSLSHRWLFVLAFLLINGCAQQGIKPSFVTTKRPDGWDAHLARVQTLQHWRVKGKIGYHSENNKGSAWFDWTQHGEEFTIYLSGPLGVGTATISGNTESVTLSRPGETDIRARSSGELTQKLFGSHLPLEQLRYWAKGIPAPSDGTIHGEVHGIVEAFNKQGTASKIKQDRWDVNLRNYRPNESYQLPGKLIATRQALTVTLILKNWDIQKTSNATQTTNP